MNKIYQTTFVLKNNSSGVTDSFESTRAVLNDMPHTAWVLWFTWECTEESDQNTNLVYEDQMHCFRGENFPAAENTHFHIIW